MRQRIVSQKALCLKDADDADDADDVFPNLVPEIYGTTK